MNIHTGFYIVKKPVLILDKMSLFNNRSQLSKKLYQDPFISTKTGYKALRPKLWIQYSADNSSVFPYWNGYHFRPDRLPHPERAKTDLWVKKAVLAVCWTSRLSLTTAIVCNGLLRPDRFVYRDFYARHNSFKPRISASRQCRPFGFEFQAVAVPPSFPWFYQTGFWVWPKTF